MPAASDLVARQLARSRKSSLPRPICEWEGCWRRTPPAEKREEAIFEIVNQLNRGTALITSPDEREQLAELNLIAGKRAKASTAYASALKYLVAGDETSILAISGGHDDDCGIITSG